jgi:hypothetical protein
MARRILELGIGLGFHFWYDENAMAAASFDDWARFSLVYDGCSCYLLSSRLHFSKETRKIAV